MSAIERNNPKSDIDISMPDGKQKTHWTVHAVIWVTVLSAFSAMFFFQAPFEWVLGGLIGAAIFSFGGWLAWNLIVRRGALTWMRLAYKPAKLYAAGESAGADAALAQAIARADTFPPGSQPRGMMLEPIAEYLGNQGRSKEARKAFEECVETLAKFANSNPMDYFVALNNFAVFLLYHKEYEASQRILERVLDLALASKKGANHAVTITDGQLQTIQFVLHLNLVCVYLEMHESEEMRFHLFETNTFFDALPARTRKEFHDHFLALRSRCLFERKKYEAAWEQLDEAFDANHFNVVRMRGRLHLHEQAYAEAEACFERYEASQAKTFATHHPQHLDLRLHVAECQFHQGNFEEAFASLQEARSLVADFALPRDARWREKVQPWQERAEQHGKSELANAIAEEIRQSSMASDTAIVVLERFRAKRTFDEN